MSNTTFIAYCIGLVTALILFAAVEFFPLYCFKHRNFKNCQKCTVVSCPNSSFWRDDETPAHGLFRFSPVIIIGSIAILAATLLATLWFVLIFVL